MDYALIENGNVINLIWLHPTNESDFPNAVSTNELPIQIGDTYQDGKFYRDGKEVLPYNPQPSSEQAVIDGVVKEVSEVGY